MRLEAVLHRTGLVVDAGIEAELLHDPLAFRRTAGDADGAAALDLRELPDRLADRAGGAGHDDGLAGLRLADVQQAEVAGHARHAEDVQPLCRRADAQIDLDEFAAAELARAEGRVLLHAESAADVVADGERRPLGGDDDADAAGAHDLVDRHRRDVALAFVHPPTHRRI